MNTAHFHTEIEGRLAAAAIDSGAALALCGILLEVVAQMPEAHNLIRAAIARAGPIEGVGEPIDRAAELIALDRLRLACDQRQAA